MLGTGAPADTLMYVCDRTHSSLHALVERYISSIDASQWPAPLRAQGDRAVDAACQYGLGIIRMLAEYQVLEGIPDTQCAQLAARLMTACTTAKEAISRTGSQAGSPPELKPMWRAGHRRHCVREGNRTPSAPVRVARSRTLTPAAASAPPATSASVGTPAARGSGGTPGADAR